MTDEQKEATHARSKGTVSLVLDLKSMRLLERRLTPRPSLADTLFALSGLGDDRAIANTHVAGERRYSKHDRVSGV